MKDHYFVPYIHPKLHKFFDEHKDVIQAIFKVVKIIKPHIVDSYVFSKKYPPRNRKYKYTEKLYIGCILYILKKHSSWTSFIGPIDGKLLNKRHHEYLRNKIYKKFYKEALKKYLKTADIKYLSMDSSIFNNKYNIEVSGHLPINKNRKGCKNNTIVDENKIPLIEPVLADSTVHDSRLAINSINKLLNNDSVTDNLATTKGHIYMLADTGYDSDEIRNHLRLNNIKPIIKPNNRRRIYKKKRRLARSYRRIYRKRRIKVEHLFAMIKKYSKINCVYEKNIRGFEGLLLLIYGYLIINRFLKT